MLSDTGYAYGNEKLYTNTILSAGTAASSHNISISSPSRDKRMNISSLVLEVGFSS